jgi:hypothetical protein
VELLVIVLAGIWLLGVGYAIGQRDGIRREALRRRLRGG